MGMAIPIPILAPVGKLEDDGGDELVGAVLSMGVEEGAELGVAVGEIVLALVVVAVAVAEDVDAGGEVSLAEMLKG